MEKEGSEKNQTFKKLKKINKKEKDDNEKVNDKKKITSRYLLIFNQPNKSDTNIRPDNVFKIIDELKKINSIKDETAIYLLLGSRGGNIYSAYKIINIIRSKCSELISIIPIRAKSAATLMALGSNKIVMGPQSELGPLDLPMEHPILEGIEYRMSALDGIKPLEFFANLSGNMASQLFDTLRNDVGLSRKDSIELAFKFSEDFMEPITSKLDPWLVNMCDRELCIAEIYSVEFLIKYMLKNEKIAKDIANELVRNFPSHSFSISAERAYELGLEIIDSEDFSLWEELWKKYLDLPDNSETIELFEEDQKEKQQTKSSKIFKARMI